MFVFFVGPIVLTTIRFSRFVGKAAGSAESHLFWGVSSVGRALEWHSRGQGFEPPILHCGFAAVKQEKREGSEETEIR